MSLRGRELLAALLVALIFVSKISFEFVPGVPFSFSYLIYQHGLHPYLNVILNFVLGFPLFILWWSHPPEARQRKVFLIFCGAMALTLTTQTLIQALTVNQDRSLFFQLSGLLMALFLVLIFGIVLPTILKTRQLTEWLWRWSTLLIGLSVLILIIRPDVAFKGGRFIGIFKHIPYMVTAATLSFIFTLPRLFFLAKTPQKRLLYSAILLVSLYCILLTGTRSAVAAAGLSLILLTLLTPTPTTEMRYLKFCGLILGVSFSLLFGPKLLETSYEIIRGEQAMMGRAAQDGIATRLDEVQRGLEQFQTHPLVGLGLMYKYMGAPGDDVDVDNYNSFKDPHNIIVSAGVIGGWPFLLLVAVGVFFIAGAILLKLFAESLSLRWVAIYMLSHLPILLIYHVHLSIGGMADRIYWLGFGLMALSAESLRRPQNRPSLK